MQSLVRGVHHFRENVFDTQRALFAHLKEGQNPEALFITCSDSRIDEHLVTQTQPGDIFVLRNAGNIIPPYGAANGGEGATIEFAIVALGISHIVVCGHTHCGAMKGLLHPETLGELPQVAAWLKHAEATRLIVRDQYADLEGDEEARVLQTAKENVLVQIENLQTHPVVAAGLAAGRLKLHGWLYAFETGIVLSYDPAQKQFVPLPDTDTPLPPRGHYSDEYAEATPPAPQGG